MDMLECISCTLSNVSEVTEDCLSNASNEADQTPVNRHTNRMLQLALQLALFKVSVWTQLIINL